MTARRVEGEGATALRLLAPELLREPVQPEVLERSRPRFTRLAVEADLGVPGVQHLLPLRADRLALRRTVDRGRAVARRRILHGSGVAAAKRGGAVDNSRALSEAQRLLDGEGPARRRRERPADVLEADARREDADAERVLERAPPAKSGDVLGHLLAVERIDARGLADLRGMHGIARLHGRRGGRARVEHLLPARTVVVAARRRALLDVDRAILGLAAELLSGALDALGQHVTEPFAAADHLEQTPGALDVAPLELEAQLLAGDVALLLALHDPAAQPAPLVHVDARLVALGVEPGDTVAIGRADRPAAARPALVLGLVDDLAFLVAVADDRHVAVVHPARVALMPAVLEVLAQLRRFPGRHVGAGDVRGQVGRVVLDRQGAHLRKVHDARQGAVLVERPRGRVGLQVVRHVLGRLHQPARIDSPQRLRALHDRDGLEPLLAHHRAAAVLGRDVTEVALDRRELHEVLAGRPDRVDRELMAGEAGLAVQRVLRLPGIEPHERLGVAELDDIVIDVEVDPVLRLPLDDDRVVPAILEVGAEEAVGLRRGRSVRARPDRAHGQTARAPHRQAREWTGAQHEPVVGMVPRDVLLATLRGRLAIEDHRAEADAAELGAHPFGAPRLGPARAAREVDAQQVAGEPAGSRGRGGLRSGLLRCGHGRWSHTATGLSPGAFDGRPRMVSGSRLLVVFVAINAGLMSNGFFFRCAFQVPSATPDCTRPFSMPTSLVVQMSLEGPRMMAPVSRSPRQRSLRYAGRSAFSPLAVSALASSQAPKDATSR